MFKKFNLIILLFISTNIFFIESKLIEVKISDAQKTDKIKKEEFQPIPSDYFEKIMGINEDYVITAWNKRNENDQYLKSYNKIIKSAFERAESKEDLKEALEEFIPLGDLQEIIISYLKNLLRNTKNGQHFQVGNFQQITLDRLREVKLVGNNGKFNVIVGTSLDSWYMDELDFAALQSKKENRDAIFQVFTNTNAFELFRFPNDKVKYHLDEGIDFLIFDKTDIHPYLRSVFSTIVGLIYRFYYVFQPKGKPTMWRQTNDKQINLLDLLPEAYPVKEKDGIVYLEGSTKKDIAVGKIKIGYLPNIQVTYGSLSSGSKFFYDPAQVINQVYTTIIYWYDSNKVLSAWSSWDESNESDELKGYTLKLTNPLIMAAYEGAIRSAVLFKKTKLFLTMPPEPSELDYSLIADAILKNKNLIKKSNLDIKLIISNFTAAGKNLELFKNKLLELCEYTNGKFLIYKDDGVYELKQDKNTQDIESFYSLLFNLNLLAKVK